MLGYADSVSDSLSPLPQIHLERRGEARRSVDSAGTAGTAGRLIHMFTVSGLISD